MATAELKVAFTAATVVAPGEISAGESTAENEPEEKLSFFLGNSSLPSCISFLGRRARPLLCQNGFHISFPGVQRKGKGGINLKKREVELLALLDQRLAEGHALRGVH